MEPAAWRARSGLAHCVLCDCVRSFGDYFRFSFAQLADAGSPLISGKTSSDLGCEHGRLLSLSWKRHPPLRELFARRNPISAGLLKKNAAWSDQLADYRKIGRASCRDRVFREEDNDTKK